MSSPPALVRKRTRQAVAGPNEAVAPALLEYQSPTAAMLAREVPAASHSTIWVIAVLFSAMLAAAALVPIATVVTAAGKVTAITGNLTVQPL